MAEPQPNPSHPSEQPPPPHAEFLPPDMRDMEAARSLGELAVNQELTVVQERGLFGDLITAQPVQRHRDDAKILQKVDIWAAIAGERWYYRYPVRNRRTGRTDYIEGPSVKATNAIARLFGNCTVESRTTVMPGDPKQYICYSRFGDLETGFSITKGQLVPRSATLGGEDEERRQAIAHNIAQSKSQRNVVDAAIGDFVQRGFAGAKDSIVARIGRNIEKARERIVELLLELGRDKDISTLVTRVEYVTGRKVNEWLAPDIAGIHAEIEAVKDGFASIDEQWPLPAPPEPRRGDAAAAEQPPLVTATAATAASPPNPSDGSAPSPSNTEVPKPVAGAAGEGTEGSGITSPSPTPPPLRNWTLPPGLMGQDAVIKGLNELLDMTESDADQDEFERQNAERIAKITGVKGQTLRAGFAAKRKARGDG
jgi:hypothetical protein